MNPQDPQSNYWKPDPDAQPSVENDYPQATYAPDEASDEVSQSTEQTDTDARPPVDDAPIQWTAHEYVHLDKGAWWFVLFGLIALALIAVDIFLLRSWTFSVLVVVMSVAVIVYVRRPPREIQYALSPRQGLYIGERLYHFDDFKSFGIIDDDGHHSIMLVPVKRFAPGVSVYFPEEIGEKLVDMLASRLPMEELKLDAIDILIRKLRF